MKCPPRTRGILRRSYKIAQVLDRSESRAVTRPPEAPAHCAASASAFTVAPAAKGGNLDDLALRYSARGRGAAR
jgi:hypothetical protein